MGVVTAGDEKPRSVAGDIQAVARASWQRPAVTKIEAVDAETGVNSTTDATVTFS